MPRAGVGDGAAMIAIASHARPKIARLVALLATDSDGECLAAARALGRTLDSVGLDFNDLAAAIEVGGLEDSRSCETWSTVRSVDALKALLASNRLSQWERSFVNDIARLLYAGGGLSAAQLHKLQEIYGQRIGGDA